MYMRHIECTLRHRKSTLDLFRPVDYVAIEDETLVLLPGERYSLCESNGINRAFGEQGDSMWVSTYDPSIWIIAFTVFLNQPLRDSTDDVFLALEHQAVTYPVLDVDTCSANTQQILNQGFLLLVISFDAGKRSKH